MRKLTVLALVPLTEPTSLGAGLCNWSSEVRGTAESGLLARSSDPMLDELEGLWEPDLAVAILEFLFALDRLGIGFRDITRGFG